MVKRQNLTQSCRLNIVNLKWNAVLAYVNRKERHFEIWTSLRSLLRFRVRESKMTILVTDWETSGLVEQVC